MADTEFNGKLTEASIISNPAGAGKTLTQEQPVFDFVPTHNGAYDFLKGVENINAHMQIALKMIAGKGNNVTEVFGEDVQENTYASKIAGVAARLDSQLDEEQERTGIRADRLNWSYARKGAENSYVKTADIGITDERVHSKDIEEMPVEEKADTVTSVQRFNGEMDIAGGRTHFRFNHWIYGEEIEVREEKRILVNRPIMPLPAPVRKGFGKFVIGFGESGKIAARSVDASRRVGRNKKMLSEIDTIKSVLTSEPMFASEIAEKTGLKTAKVSQIIKAALNGGVIKTVNKKNQNRKMVPAYFL